jgi:uncharacterized membrane protein YcaP (DUF421 family)
MPPAGRDYTCGLRIPMIHDMFHLPLPVVEKVLRATFVYLFLIVALRVAGKRELAQLSTTDFVVLLAVANAVQNAIIGTDDSVTGGVVGALTLFVLNGALAVLLWRSARARRLVEGTPTVLVKNGKVLHENLRREHITQAELRVAVQRQNADDLDEVEEAVLEPGGAIVVKSRVDRDQLALEEIKRKLDEVLARLDAGASR